jgi:integrase
MASLVRTYIVHADAYYRHADGTPTKSPASIRQAMKPLVKHFGTLPAEEFGPLKLKEIRKTMLGQTRLKKRVEVPRYCRKEINKRIGMIKSMFKWAVSEELLPANCHHALQAVRGLERGRSTATDHPKVQPADMRDVEAVLPYTSPVVAAMVRLQLLTGMRSGELVIMRPCDVDTKSEEDVWLYRLPEGRHKTAHHGHDRTVIIGPRGQAILRPYLLRSPEAYCFSPTESDGQRRRARHEERKTPLSCGNRPGMGKGMSKIGDRYDTGSYGKAVRYAIKAANKALKKQAEGAGRGDEFKPIHWTPHQLRHTAATLIRSKMSLDAARVTLGQKDLAVTQIYAERDLSLAKTAALKFG